MVVCAILEQQKQCAIMARMTKFDIAIQYHVVGVRKMLNRRIGELRIDNDLKQSMIAKFLHIDRTTYSKYETGRLDIPVPILVQLAKFHNTSTDYLLRFDR